MPTSNGVTAWSWSRYKLYKDCPAAFKYDAIDHRPRGPAPPPVARGDAIHVKAEGFAKRETTELPRELRYFEKQFKELIKLNPIVEKGWAFRRDWSYIDRPGEWYGPDVWLRVKTDVSIVYPDNTGEVIDHKTGKMYAENEEQVGLFALAGFNRFPKLTHITARLWYLDLGEEVIEEYDAADIPTLRKKWERNIKPMFNDRRFPPRPSWRCGRCTHSRANGGPCKF